MDWLVIVRDVAIALFLAATIGLWKKATGIDNKFVELELDLAKNYVTKQELKAVEDKLDTLSEIMNSKIDVVNNNILLLLTKRD